MANTEKFVIKVENGDAVNHPLTYSNFLLLFPCPRQETPTNEVIGAYGYEVFMPAIPPRPGVFDHAPEIERYVKINDAWTQQWRLVPFTQEEKEKRIQEEWELLRRTRNYYLTLTDWTQLMDTPLSLEERMEWTDYRQALRSFPETVEDPFNPQWPTPPKPVRIPTYNTVKLPTT